MVSTSHSVASLSDGERSLLRALASAALPPGRLVPGADDQTIQDALTLLQHAGSAGVRGWLTLVRAVDATARMRFGRGFASLALGERMRVLDAWRDGPGTRHLLRGVLTPLKVAHFASRRSYDALRLRFDVPLPSAEEPARWRSQVTDSASLDEDIELECDVVIIGTGAGGAPVAKELAERGFAVLLLEEGAYFGRRDFSGRPVEMLARLYRRGGLTPTLGNTAILVPVGKSVGGTTTVNAGTSLRPPTRVQNEWRHHLGVDLDASVMEPYYDRVESFLGVGPSSSAALGGPANVIARGAEALGWSHHPLPRNAPGCDGQGLCCFGCPTEAKRSTNVSYIPAALQRGAQLITGVKVEEILLDGDTARGVRGVARGTDGTTREVRVQAGVVVLACGALHTPAMLLRQGLANASGQLGKNLTIHPASNAFALFDEPIDGHQAVPQGYAVDEFLEDGIMFEGATAPPELAAASITCAGPAFIDVMERYANMLGFGFMIEETSRGRVRAARDGSPVVTYNLNDSDVALLKRGMTLLGQLFFAAGAREVFPAIAGFGRLRHPSELDALARARLPARAFDLTAYHPLGTARMGPDPLRSVIGPTHETHDVLNLYIVDGSAVPGPLGANPQLTIMAMATRASEHIAHRLERLSAHAQRSMQRSA